MVSPNHVPHPSSCPTQSPAHGDVDNVVVTLHKAVGDVLRPRSEGSSSPVMGAGSDDLTAGLRYLQSLAPGGWATPTWPEEHGGRGASPSEARVIARALSAYERPDLYPYAVGLHLVGPTLLRFGTADQQRRWLRPIAGGSEIWCQMFSEPEAGSDLANVATRAERDGDSWRLQGQKVWTSRGSYATWGLCLARTDPEVPKHAGMTMFAVRMDAPGVTVRPLVQMNGDRHFSEVFLDEVPVPDSDRIGDVDAGWTVALAVLAFERSEFGERGTGGDGRAGLRRVPGWLRELADLGALRDPVLRDRAMGIVSGELAARITALRASVSRSQGRPGPEGSGGKIRWSRLAKRRADLVKAAYGAHGMLTDHPGHLDALTAPSLSIRGGADEIQLNILGERVLGLAPEPRSDRQVPWTVSRRGGATQDG